MRLGDDASPKLLVQQSLRFWRGPSAFCTGRDLRARTPAQRVVQDNCETCFKDFTIDTIRNSHSYTPLAAGRFYFLARGVEVHSVRQLPG